MPEEKPIPSTHSTSSGQASSGQSKKHGLLKIIFKILTLGGLLVVIYQALRKSEEKKK